MAGYNRERVSEEFRQLAELAEAIYSVNSGRLVIDRQALKSHDELLAAAVVYRYLQDGHFLATPELLLSELRLLRANGHPPPPQNALRIVDFVKYRMQLLDVLIARFQGLLAFRDEIGAGEESPMQAFERRRRRTRPAPLPPTRR